MKSTKAQGRSQRTPVRVSNSDIAAMLDELADLEEIAGANPFRIRAYRNAARFIAESSRSMTDLLAEGRDLSSLPGRCRSESHGIADHPGRGWLGRTDVIKPRSLKSLGRLLRRR